MFMSIKEILKLIKSLLGCYRVIRYFKFANHRFQCRRCGSENEKRQDNPGRVKCADCHKSESLTANTIFHGHRKELTELMPIVLSVVIDKGKSALAVARELKLHYSTVWEWLKKARSYFADLLSPDNSQSVHYSLLLKAFVRRSCESTPECPAGCRLPNDSTASKEVDKNEMEPPPIGKELEVPDHNCAGRQVVPNPADPVGLWKTLRYLAVLFHPGVSLKHAPGYTLQVSYITSFPENVQMFLAACCRAAPKAIARSEFLTLPLMANAASEAAYIDWCP